MCNTRSTLFLTLKNIFTLSLILQRLPYNELNYEIMEEETSGLDLYDVCTHRHPLYWDNAEFIENIKMGGNKIP